MRRSLVVLLVALAVTPVLISAGAAAPSDGSANYTMSELSERGQRIEGADPSRRWFGERGSIFVSYEQTNIVKKMASQRPEWAVDRVVSSDKVVDTREVKLHINRPRSAPDKTIHVKVIAWKTEERTVNGTDGRPRQVEYPTDIRTQTTEITLSNSFETATVELPDTEAPQTVTMYVQEYPSSRWVFPNDPVATADQVPFGTSWGDYLGWFLMRFFLITVIGVPIAIGAAYKTLDYTYTGPGKGVMWWLIALGLGSYLALYFSHRNVTLLLTSAPWIMGVFVDVVAYVATLELADATEKGLFEAIVTTDATNPLGDDIADIANEHGDTVSYVDDGDGTIKLVKPSLTYFVTLLLGAKPPEIDRSKLQTRVKYRGSAPGDEKFYANVDDDRDENETLELPEIEWPALTFGPSNLKRQIEGEDGEMIVDEWDSDRIIRSGLLGLLAGAVASALSFGTALSLAVAIGATYVATVRREDGWASFDPAPAHATAAKARVISERQELTIAETFEQLQSKVAEADSQTTEQAVDIAEAYIGQLRSQLDRLLGGDDRGGLPDGPVGESSQVDPDPEAGVGDD